MTISSLAKIITGVKRMVVENVEIENPETNPTIIISVRPTKRDSCRCGICGKKCSGYDKGNGRRRWRAMDIGNSSKVYLESDSPRVWCKEHGVTVQMVPWARHGSKHTKGFEDTAVWMSLHLSRKAVSEYLRVSWDTVGPMVSRVERETRPGDKRYDGLVKIGIDETSYKKGHKYITIVINHDTNAVEKLKTLPRYKDKLEIDNGKIKILNQKQAIEFIKMLNDSILRSELTDAEYDSTVKTELPPIQ